MRPILCLDGLLVFGEYTCISKIFVDLFIKVVAVSHNQEGKVPWNFPKHFLGEEHHGETLPASLGVPEYA